MEYIQKILTKEMTRKEFLVYLGMLFLTIFGISSLLKSLSKLSPSPRKQPKIGFGAGPYGV